MAETARVYVMRRFVRQANGSGRWLGLVCALSCTLLAVLALGGAARATTGPTALYYPPRWTVARADARPFLGRYTLTGHGPNLISGELRTAYNRDGYLEGNFAAYQYGTSGQESSWVAVTYEYHYIKGQMELDLWSSDDNVLLGHLILRSAPDRKLVGQLISGGRSQPVIYSPAAPQAAAGLLSKAEESGNFSAPSATSQAQGWGIFGLAVQVAHAITAL